MAYAVDICVFFKQGVKRVQREAKQSFACVDEVTIYWSFTSTSFAFE
jgi:hypothetical protein